VSLKSILPGTDHHGNSGTGFYAEFYGNSSPYFKALSGTAPVRPGGASRSHLYLVP
jgi:hypothetical protein